MLSKGDFLRMELKKKNLTPICGEEDPTLPWPDGGDNVTVSPDPGPEELPTPEVTPDDETQTPDNGTQLPSDSIDPNLLSLGMAFVPRQAWETPYAFDVALKRGTIFPSLDKPFLGEEALPR